MNEYPAEKFVAIYRKVRLNNTGYKYICESIELVTKWDDSIKKGINEIYIEEQINNLNSANIEISIDNVNSEIFTNPIYHNKPLNIEVKQIDDYIKNSPNYLLLDIPPFPQTIIDIVIKEVENLGNASQEVKNYRIAIREKILYALSKVYGSIEIKEERGNIYASIDNSKEDVDYCYDNGFTDYAGPMSQNIIWFLNYFEEKYLTIWQSKKNNTRKIKGELHSPFRNNFELEIIEDPPQTYTLNEENRASNITPENLKNIITRTSNKFVGQEDVVFDLATSIYVNNILSSKSPEQVARTKDVILLDGSTGTGKTAIINALSKEFDIPSVCIYAPSITPTGYKGSDLTECLDKLFESADKDIQKAERGIVYIDEFDKLTVFGNKDAATYRAMVQKELLGFGFGNVYEIKNGFNTISFDTSKLTIIYMGSFAEVKDNIKESDKYQRKIGFNNTDNPSPNNPIIDGDVLTQNGFLRELVGRIKLYISTKDYTKEDLINILKNSSISPLNELITICKEDFGKTLIYDKEFINAIAGYGVKLKTGARSLQTICNSIRNTIKMELIFGIDKEIYLTTDIIYNLEKNKGRNK